MSANSLLRETVSGHNDSLEVGLLEKEEQSTQDQWAPGWMI